MRYSLKTHIIACIIAAFCVNGSLSQINQPCLSSKKTMGTCINIAQCPPLLSLLTNPLRTPEDTQFLQQNLCHREGSNAYVCCVLESGSRFYVSGESLLPTIRECGKSFDNRIYSGNVTKIDEYPWLALIEYTKPANAKGFHCGATLINKRYVVTAAHCVTGAGLPADWKPTGIRLGEWDRSTDPDCTKSVNNRLECADPHVDVAIQEIVFHPSYNSRDLNHLYDIALIRLAREVTYTDFVSPVCLPIQTELRPRTFDGEKLDVVGFGATETGSSSALKLKAGVDAWNFETCRQKYAPKKVNLQNSQMCAGGQAGVDSCSGDSGGPLVIQQRIDKRDVYVLAGIVSFGPKPCGLPGWPGVYTRVGAYADWILNNIKP
ncbi:serine protease easter isoform X2 [Stomoxys calcitrans]|uniref:CLIP domain-containing serine protease n=1 Tax=Stomoxys calcitrans TaxID=35570 RepID=A0A1I8PEC5_STOCA|nr:serine protease easter isoform X2 [Stomoxys calcitrans]